MSTPQVDLYVNARDAICAGDQDFVYTTDGLGVVAWAYPNATASDKAWEKEPRNFPGGERTSVEEMLEYGNAESTLSPSFTLSVIDAVLRQNGLACNATLHSPSPHTAPPPLLRGIFPNRFPAFTHACVVLRSW